MTCLMSVFVSISISFIIVTFDTLAGDLTLTVLKCVAGFCWNIVTLVFTVFRRTSEECF